jgi:type VI secretion system protein ImpA
MASEPLIDLDALLAPIPGANPAGANLIRSADHDEIKALLPKPDRDALEPGGQAGQWPKIVQATTKKLREKSKDLYIASWLTEALVQIHGVAGLKDGLKLIHGLLERYWENVYPLAEDPEVRAAPLVTLLERNAPLWVGEVPLTRAPIRDPATDEVVPVTYNLWHSITVAKLDDKIPLEPLMMTAVGDTPNDFYLRQQSDIEESLVVLAAINGLLDERLKEHAPGITAAREALKGCGGRVKAVLSARGVGLEEEEGAGEGTEGGGAGMASNGAGKGPVRSRQDALARLHEVAEFFRRTEPHSPVPYLILRAINWSRLSFDKLLTELVKDQTALQQIHSTLGISDNGESDSHTTATTMADTET